MQKSLVILSDFYHKKLFFHFLNEFRDIFLLEELENLKNNNLKKTIFCSDKLEKYYHKMKS